MEVIPPASTNPVHRLRNLPNQPTQPTFRKTAEKQQRNFADGLRSRGSRLAYAGTESTVRDYDEETEAPSTPVILDSPHRFEMATPKFFPRSDFATDTGLESLFTGVFSLEDDPPEVRAAHKAREEQIATNRKHGVQRAAWERIGGIVMLFFAFWAWSYAGRTVIWAQTLRYSAVGIAAVVSGRGLFEALRMDKAYWRLSDILVLVVELAIAIFFGSEVKSSGMRNYAAEDVLGIGPPVFLGFLLLQELKTVATKLKSSSTEAGSSGLQGQSSTAGSNSKPVSTSPSRPERSLALVQQQSDMAVETGSASTGVRQPLKPQPKKKRESYVPSSSLSGLSLGLGGDESNVMSSPRLSSSKWAGDTSNQMVSRNTRSRIRIPPWERGTL